MVARSTTSSWGSVRKPTYTRSRKTCIYNFERPGEILRVRPSGAHAIKKAPKGFGCCLKSHPENLSLTARIHLRMARSCVTRKPQDVVQIGSKLKSGALFNCPRRNWLLLNYLSTFRRQVFVHCKYRAYRKFLVDFKSSRKQEMPKSNYIDIEINSSWIKVSTNIKRYQYCPSFF